jgi:hypothetical protein
MIDYPCNNRCPTYAMCRQRNSIEKYEVCSIFRDYVICIIKESQDEMDKEHGKGNITVVGVRVKGKGVLMDNRGKLISGDKKERIYV